MRINGNAIRPGNVVEHKGGLWKAVKIAHTQPGKGGAYLQVELRNLPVLKNFTPLLLVQVSPPSPEK